jgi:hypothetical protein
LGEHNLPTGSTDADPMTQGSGVSEIVKLIEEQQWQLHDDLNM